MPSSNRLRIPAGIASVVLHLALLAVLVQHRAPWVAPMRLPGTAHGTRLELTYSPGRAPAVEAKTTPHVAPKAAPKLTARISPRETPIPTASVPATAIAPAAQPTIASGNDALGEGNVSIAFASFFPRPKPDLSPLAHGSAGDVVLDVTISADGKVADIKLTQSLSPAIDQTVIATVQQWTFRPATKDGQPVASEQELHFHYERG